MNASMVYQSAMAAALAAPIESPLDYLERQHGFVTIKTSAGGSARIRNCADRLREFADTVRKNWAAYGGGAKPAELAKPRKPRAIAWPAVTVKVWRELIEAGEFADAFALGSEKLGQLVYSGGRAAFAIVAPLPVDGLPADFASGRRDDGKYVVFDTVSGVAIGARGAASRKAAEESAREMWNDRTEEQHATALRSARNMYNTAPEAARAAWLTEHGIACDAPAAPEPIAEEIQPEPAADDAAPVSDCMAAIIEAASEPEPVADDVAIAHAEFDAAGAADTASHPLEAAAQHLEKRRAQLAAADPAAVGFMRELVRYAERDHAELAAAFAVFDSIGDGTELSTADGKRHCILVPDASEPGRYRYSMFDARGFFSHSTHNTAAEAVADAARAGFTVAAPGVLDRLAVTQEWEHGSAVAAVMQEHNGGRISWADACAEFDRLAAVYAKPAEPAPELAPIAAEPEPEAAPAEPINPEPSGIVGLILHNVLVPFVNAAPDGKPAAADLMREADRLRLSSARVLADCIGMPTERCARQTASDYAEVARRLELMAEPEPEPEPIAPDAPDTAPPVPAAPAARDLSLSYAAHVAQSRAIGSRPMSCAQWVRNNTPKPAAPIAPPNPGNPGRAAHPGRCSARRPGVAVRIKPAAPAASRAPGRLAARNIRAAGFRSHRAAIAPHRAGRLAAASRGAVRSIGCAGRPGRGAPPAAGCTILQAPGQAAGGAAGPGPPSGATPRPADSQTPYSRRFPHTGDSP